METIPLTTSLLGLILKTKSTKIKYVLTVRTVRDGVMCGANNYFVLQMIARSSTPVLVLTTTATASSNI